jgi:hypothetical protein
MFVTHLYVDHWQERCDYGTESDNPTWPQIESAINALDGLHKTQVILSDTRNGSAYMIPNNFDFYSLTDPAQPDEAVMLFVGGQNGEYALQKLVPRGDTIDAAKQFCENGELHNEMNWSSDY